MKILLAFDSFKGTLSAKEACEYANKGLGDGFETVILPMADGGEGSAEVISQSSGGRLVSGVFPGVFGEPATAHYCIRGKTAFIEAAQTCGLTLVPAGKRNIMNVTSAGVGAQIRDALGKGCTDITVCVGGTAGNDGGMGMAREMGFRFLGGDSHEVTVSTLTSLERIVIPDTLPRFYCTSATDVTNVLCGTEGAAHVFARQKGATDAQIELLEAGMETLARVVLRQTGTDLNATAGAGAGGGLGGGLAAFLGAVTVSGFECVSRANGFEEALRDCDAVITGEGKTDEQTVYGKVPYRVARCAMKYKKPCYIVSGRVRGDMTALSASGATAIVAASGESVPDSEAFANAGERLSAAVAELRSVIGAGI